MTTYYDIDEVLKNALVTATSLTVYALEKPKSVSLPCVAYKRISEKNYLSNTGRPSDKLTGGRFQVTLYAANYADLRTYVKLIEAKLIGNNVDFDSSVPDEAKFEIKLDDVYYYHRDYFIMWHEDKVIA